LGLHLKNIVGIRASFCQNSRDHLNNRGREAFAFHSLGRRDTPHLKLKAADSFYAKIWVRKQTRLS